jgi:hypothetical protein
VEKLSADNFFEKLQKDTLETSIPFSIVGMVKKADGKEKVIEFAPGGNCSNWVKIPLEFVEDAEVLKTVSCKDHSHPLVKLNLKTPKTAEGKIFFGILEGMKHGMAPTEQPHHLSRSGDGRPNTQAGSGRGYGRRINQGPGGFGTIGGGLNDWGNCRVLEYQCTCVEWEHTGFGVDSCIRKRCEYVCVEYSN